jgi:hypothetical protein
MPLTPEAFLDALAYELRRRGVRAFRSHASRNRGAVRA